MAKLKLKRLKLVVEVPIFRRQILVLIGYDINQVLAELETWNDSQCWSDLLKNEPDVTNGITSIRPSDGALLFWCRHMLDSVESYATMVHESFHATEFILDYVGVSHNIGISNEVYAYTQQFIVESIFRELTKYGL